MLLKTQNQVNVIYNYLYRCKLNGPQKKCFENTTNSDLLQVSKYYNKTDSRSTSIKRKIKREKWQLIVKKNCKFSERAMKIITENGGKYTIIKIKDLPKYSNRNVTRYKRTYPVVIRNMQYISTVDFSNKTITDGWTNLEKYYPKKIIGVIDPPPVVIPHRQRNPVKKQPQKLIPTRSLHDHQQLIKNMKFDHNTKPVINILTHTIHDCLFIESKTCGPIENGKRTPRTPEILSQIYNREFRNGSFISKGAYGSVFNVEKIQHTKRVPNIHNKDWVVKKLSLTSVNSLQSVKEIEMYEIASRLGFGPEYYGWGICAKFLYIFMEKMYSSYNFNNNSVIDTPQNVNKLMNLIDQITTAGYYSDDFHANNIMYNKSGQLKLIDPSLKLIANTMSCLNSKFKIPPPKTLTSQNIKYVGMFFMLRRISCKKGGIDLDRVPNLKRKIIKKMSNHIILVKPGLFYPKLKRQYKIFNINDLCHGLYRHRNS
ncbi:MAG: hypothetical protein JKX76_02345 [Colwellia sp.]|nr:hypothetical protein [Colwellia sp.]